MSDSPKTTTAAQVIFAIEVAVDPRQGLGKVFAAADILERYINERIAQALATWVEKK